jgi:hypothetical protein
LWAVFENGVGGLEMDWQRVAEIEGRAEKATPGPWRVPDVNPLVAVSETVTLGGGVGCAVVQGEFTLMGRHWEAKGRYADQAAKDVAFAAASRADVPWLCERLREMQAALREAVDLADRATDWNLSEAEVGGKMVSVYDLAEKFRSLLPSEEACAAPHRDGGASG